MKIVATLALVLCILFMCMVTEAAQSFAFNSNMLQTAVQSWCKNSAAAEDLYGPISTWDVSAVTSMKSLFKDCHLDNRQSQSAADLSKWITNRVTDMSEMFYNTSNFNHPLSFDTSSVKYMYWMFAYSSFNNLIPFDTSRVEDMSNMFFSAFFFNSPCKFNTAKVTDMAGMFRRASAFNQPVPFDTSSVTSTSQMFAFASSFNQPCNFNTVKVTNLDAMFFGASAFNQPLNFDMSSVSDSTKIKDTMFQGATAFNKAFTFDPKSGKTMPIIVPTSAPIAYSGSSALQASWMGLLIGSLLYLTLI